MPYRTRRSKVVLRRVPARVCWNPPEHRFNHPHSVHELGDMRCQHSRVRGKAGRPLARVSGWAESCCGCQGSVLDHAWYSTLASRPLLPMFLAVALNLQRQGGKHACDGLLRLVRTLPVGRCMIQINPDPVACVGCRHTPEESLKVAISLSSGVMCGRLPSRTSRGA